MKFPHVFQLDSMSCGSTCLRMIGKYYGRDFDTNYLLNLSETTREGASLLSISEAAEKIGFKTLGAKVPFKALADDFSAPCIAHWNQNHFVVVYKIKKDKVYVADPCYGLLTYKKDEFLKNWVVEGKEEGVVLFLEVTPFFYEVEGEAPRSNYNLGFLSKYLFKYRELIIQLFTGLLIGSLLQLVFPILTQSIVDSGIKNNDLNFIYLILFAQLMLFLGKTSIDIMRGWILMQISSRINISLISDFFIKLMKLPISFFDVKMTGDIMQRITDHYRIENFLTSSAISTVFSIFNLVMFGIVLAFYSINIFLVFLIGSIIYFAWIFLFLKWRAKLDFIHFKQSSSNQSKVIEMISGMQEIKLHNAEKQKRWQWEKIQIKLFRTNLKGLTLSQVQTSGSALINELKNIFITFVSAKLVIDHQITFGMMLSVSYISGQLNSPITELISFVRQFQDAKISLYRLSEIHNMEEEGSGKSMIADKAEINDPVRIVNLSFRYKGANQDVLKDINLEIPPNKVTAIVGSSGSGKSTLLKMLLKFYEPSTGGIYIGIHPLKEISPKAWRNMSGVVMQEGYIFSDSIANNIAVGVDEIDKERLRKAAETANISEFIEGLPLGYNTKIGIEGIGISTGQKQRILIARAAYKNPRYLFLDEATSALDTINENEILSNFKKLFENKTVVLIAHRLSTIKNADQIIVLDKGKIVEKGDHPTLLSQKGRYYELVFSQMSFDKNG
ncbi:MAG TPA: peptidase domain-containing ABC transporter [Bacteroidia bacterium]|jgi:ATP-binding cassette subfamily B protein|nr:peptidase domain-containing ABC transporter [Bacteroidia bacterium]